MKINLENSTVNMKKAPGTLNYRPMRLFIYCFVVCLVICLFDWMADRLIDWLADC